MTNYKLLNKINEMLKCMESRDYLTPHTELQKMKAEVLEEIELMEAKKCGNVDVLKIIKSVLKNSKKTMNSKYNTIYKDNTSNIIYCTDGYQLITYRGELPIQDIQDINKFSGLIKVAESYKNINSASEIQIPTVIELKDIISEQKAINKRDKIKNAPIYRFDGITDIGINAEYLLNMIKAGTIKIYKSGYMFIGINEDKTLKYFTCGIRL